jgi:hypothetical protein
MSDNESLEADSASRNERPAERTVMPTAVELGEALLTWATQEKEEATAAYWHAHHAGDKVGRERAYGKELAFEKVLAWARVRKANAATLRHKVGDRSS